MNFPAPDQNTSYLYLVRHGATPSNESRPYVLQGRGINQSLSENGRAQASAAGQFLTSATIHAVYSSPLLRAAETAAEIAAPHSLEVQSVDGVHEVDVGEWESLSWESIMQQWPREYSDFMENPGEVSYLGGESYRDVLNRVTPAVEGLWKKHAGQSFVLVCHNVVNRAYLAHVLGLELRKAKDIHQENGGVNIIRRRGEHTQLLTMNACSHVPTLD